MKIIFFMICFILLISGGQLKAQFEGRSFVSGSAGVSFGIGKPEEQKSTNGYGYNFSGDFGKFKTNTKAVGWSLRSNLAGGKRIYTLSDDGGTLTNYSKAGLTGFGVGVGRFWQFYKHFNDKIGVFAGPDFNLNYSYTKQNNTTSDNRMLYEDKTNSFNISVGLSAGVYYRLSEKWWINASLAFSNPFTVGYSFVNSKVAEPFAQNSSKYRQLNYSFTPSFTFPSVGFGLRYFYNR